VNSEGMAAVTEAASEARVRVPDTPEDAGEQGDPALVPTDRRELRSWYLWDWCVTRPSAR